MFWEAMENIDIERKENMIERIEFLSFQKSGLIIKTNSTVVHTVWMMESFLRYHSLLWD